MKLSEIDANFRLEGNIPDSTTFLDVRERPFRIYGLAPDAEGRFTRLPAALLPRCSEAVRQLAGCLAGACVRFSADADELCVLWELAEGANMPHFAPSGKNGMELFEETEEGSRQIAALIPALEQEGRCRLHQFSRIVLPGGMRHYALYLPLYDGLGTLLIGFPPHAEVLPGRVPHIDKPIVFYGSSVTQGACASKAGSCYSTLLARRLDAAQINLGFSGSAKGETVLAEYIASLKMSAFVYDYDYNAPSAEHLKATHERFFRIIREAQPELPVLIISRAAGKDPADTAVRREIIRDTYLNAVRAGDCHVRFADGGTLFGTADRDLCTVDGVHPTDIGFLRMADALEPVLREMLNR